jgi:hypothetical protein
MIAWLPHAQRTVSVSPAMRHSPPVRRATTSYRPPTVHSGEPVALADTWVAVTLAATVAVDRHDVVGDQVVGGPQPAQVFAPAGDQVVGADDLRHPAVQGAVIDVHLVGEQLR